VAVRAHHDLFLFDYTETLLKDPDPFEVHFAERAFGYSRIGCVLDLHFHQMFHLSYFLSILLIYPNTTDGNTIDGEGIIR